MIIRDKLTQREAQLLSQIMRGRQFTMSDIIVLSHSYEINSKFVLQVPEELKILGKNSIESQSNYEEKSIKCAIGFTLIVNRPKSDEENYFFKIMAKFEVNFKVDAENIPEVDFHEFAMAHCKAFGMNVTWPYWREMVNSATMRMGKAPVVLGMLPPIEVENDDKNSNPQSPTAKETPKIASRKPALTKPPSKSKPPGRKSLS